MATPSAVHEPRTAPEGLSRELQPAFEAPRVSKAAASGQPLRELLSGVLNHAEDPLPPERSTTVDPTAGVSVGSGDASDGFEREAVCSRLRCCGLIDVFLSEVQRDARGGQA